MSAFSSGSSSGTGLLRDRSAAGEDAAEVAKKLRELADQVVRLKD
jgi:hypothetical protein